MATTFLIWQVAIMLEPIRIALTWIAFFMLRCCEVRDAAEIQLPADAEKRDLPNMVGARRVGRDPRA